ncbi:hypothetical protein CLU79DRAFT_425530 [Phycomyces nitens]|nr:hypothetical protein CLU79DRAFT_425530 [Phycomyces nitens]
MILPVETPRKRPRYVKRAQNMPKTVEISRVSRRLKGEAPEEIMELDDLLDQNDRIRQVEHMEEARTHNEQAKKEIDQLGDSIMSIGTTIWDLGELYTGKGRSKYWSNRSCRYKHPYPIGFRATKNHFGNDYGMLIEKGPEGEGPVFTVQINGTGTIFKGATPTGPWTEACKRSKSQGTRVSGPLFHGFSDLITMSLIQNMKGYELASEPEED